MSEVERRLIADGEWYEVCCAVRADGVSSPVSEFLDTLEVGGLDESQAPDLEPDEQFSHAVWIQKACEWFAEHGEFPTDRDHNQLRDGVWEIKRYNLRVTFFDTDGEGGYNEKINFDGAGTWGRGPELPEFDDYIRLATAFVKPPKIRKTPDNEIRTAKQVREEDTSHDRTQ